MTLPTAKLAPRLIVMGIVGYCIWPSMSVLFSAPSPKSPEKIAELAKSLLSPSLPGNPTRDPFGGKMSESSANSATARKAVPAARRDGAPAANAMGSPKSNDRRAGSGRLSETGIAAALPADAPLGLVLNATCLTGNEQWAVINGRVYKNHDTIATDLTLASHKIVSVLPHKVLLERGGKVIELTYPNLPPSSNPARKEPGGHAAIPPPPTSPANSGKNRGDGSD